MHIFVLSLINRFNLKPKDIRDRIKEPAEDGYRAIHVYIKPDIEGAKKVEVQLRTLEQHHWSTLVEIVDVLYNTKIKEYLNKCLLDV